MDRIKYFIFLLVLLIGIFLLHRQTRVKSIREEVLFSNLPGGKSGREK